MHRPTYCGMETETSPRPRGGATWQEVLLHWSQAEDIERRRLAECLQDRVAQDLVAVSLRLQILRRADLDDRETTALQEAQELLRDSMAALKIAAQRLCPLLLHELGLHVALGYLIDELGRDDPLRFEYEYAPPLPPLDETIRSFAFRATRELLDHFTRTRPTAAIRLHLEGTDEGIRLLAQSIGTTEPRDAPSPDPEQKGLGLQVIRECARALGGRLQWSQMPDGDCFLLTLPPHRPEGPRPARQ